MVKMACSSIVAGMLIILVGAAQADGIALGLKAGTLGAGIEGTAALIPNVSVRVGYNTFSFGYEDKYDDVDYDLDFDLQSLSLLADWHPFSGLFRLTGGILNNQNKVSGEGVSTDSYNIGGTTYTGAELGTLNGKMDFQDIAPYFGIGWSNAVGKKKSFAFSADFGLMYQGSPEVQLSADGPITAIDPNFDDNLRQEEQNIESDVEAFKFYPVLSLGMAYQF